MRKSGGAQNSRTETLESDVLNLRVRKRFAHYVRSLQHGLGFRNLGEVVQNMSDVHYHVARHVALNHHIRVFDEHGECVGEIHIPDLETLRAHVPEALAHFFPDVNGGHEGSGHEDASGRAHEVSTLAHQS